MSKIFYFFIGFVFALPGYATTVLVEKQSQMEDFVKVEERQSSNTNLYICNQIGFIESSPIQVEFQYIGINEIFDVKIRISEASKLSDVFSSDGKNVIGRSSDEKKKPLSGLTVFSIAEENGDHFDLYLSQSNFNKQSFSAFGEIAFNDDASKLTRLNCAVKE